MYTSLRCILVHAECRKHTRAPCITVKKQQQSSNRSNNIRQAEQSRTLPPSVVWRVGCCGRCRMLSADLNCSRCSYAFCRALSILRATFSHAGIADAYVTCFQALSPLRTSPAVACCQPEASLLGLVGLKSVSKQACLGCFFTCCCAYTPHKKGSIILLL